MLFTTIASTLLVLTATPQELENRGPSPDILNVRYTNGTIARVRVLGFEGQHIKLREVVLDGSMEVRHRLSEFEPSSAFRIELAAKNPNTYEGFFAMAKRAADLGLSREAGEQVSSAMLHIADPSQAKDQELALRTWSAQSLEDWLRGAVQKRDLTKAMQYLKLIATRYADLRTEEQLDEMALLVETLERDGALSRKAKRQERLDEQTLVGIEKKLKPILADLAKGDRLYRSAISKSDKMTQSAKLASQAIDSYTSAWKTSLELQKRFPNEASLVIEIESIANHLHDHAIMAALHAANLLAARGDYLGAMRWVQWVLALDPTQSEAVELQRTITLAGAASTGGWGPWGAGWGSAGGGMR